MHYVSTIILQIKHFKMKHFNPFNHCFHFQLVSAKRQWSCRVFIMLATALLIYSAHLAGIFSKKLSHLMLCVLVTNQVLLADISKFIEGEHRQ